VDAVNFHLPDERLELYALGRLAGSENMEIEEHLLVCTSCRDRLDETEAYLVTIRAELGKPVAAERNWFSWLRPRMILAGGFAAVLLVMVGIYWSGTGRIVNIATLQLTATRGSNTPKVSPAREIDFHLPDETDAVRIDVLDSGGPVVWSGPTEQGRRGEVARVRKSLSPGDYIARTYSAEGRLKHEYLFEVR
jgi:hypothetical protein